MWSSVPDAATRIPDDVQRPLVVAGVHVDLEDPDLVGLRDLGPRGQRVGELPARLLVAGRPDVQHEHRNHAAIGHGAL